MASKRKVTRAAFMIVIALTIFRAVVLAGVLVGVQVSDASWSIIVLAFTGAWAVFGGVEFLVRREQARLKLVPSNRFRVLGDAAVMTALAVLVIGRHESWGSWRFVAWLLALVGLVAFLASSRIKHG